MVGWHHRLSAHEFEPAPGGAEGQGGLACCSPWGCRVLDVTERPSSSSSSSSPRLCCVAERVVVGPWYWENKLCRVHLPSKQLNALVRACLPLGTFLFFKFFLILKKSKYLQCCVCFRCTAKWLSYTYVYVLFQILFHCRLLQDIEYSSLCYTVGPCCLFYSSVYLLLPNL